MSWRRDSGGPGTFRGGLGVRRQWRILADETSVNLRMDRFKFSSPGVFGAKPARASKAVLESRRPGGARADLEGRGRAPQARRSAVGGIRRRRRLGRSASSASSSACATDVARGYVSRAAARDDYGVALDADLDVDDAATARLRGEKTAR